MVNGAYSQTGVDRLSVNLCIRLGSRYYRFQWETFKHLLNVSRFDSNFCWSAHPISPRLKKNPKASKSLIVFHKAPVIFGEGRDGHQVPRLEATERCSAAENQPRLILQPLLIALPPTAETFSFEQSALPCLLFESTFGQFPGSSLLTFLQHSFSAAKLVENRSFISPGKVISSRQNRDRPIYCPGHRLWTVREEKRQRLSVSLGGRQPSPGEPPRREIDILVGVLCLISKQTKEIQTPSTLLGLLHFPIMSALCFEPRGANPINAV